LDVRGYRAGGFMNILAALKREEAKLQKQADKLRQQLDAVRAARKILGREVVSGGKQIGRKKRVMSAAAREAQVILKVNVYMRIGGLRNTGYELEGHSLSPVDSVALIAMRPPKNLQNIRVLDPVGP
jgi:hypothetical protein